MATKGDSTEYKNNVHVGKGGPGHKRLFIVAGVVCVLVAAFVAGAAVQLYRNKDEKPTGKVTTDPLLSSTVDTAQREAITGNPDKAHQILSDALKKATDSKEKQDLLVQQGVTYENQGKHDQALEYYKQAEKLGITYEIAIVIGQISRTKGDNMAAISYYKKAITLLDTDHPTYAAEKQSLEDIVKSLGGQP